MGCCGGSRCPGGGAAVESAWAESTAGQTIPAFGGVTIQWTAHLNTNAAVFGTGPGPVILPGNVGAVHIETKVLVDDVGALVTAALAGTVITQNDGASGRWFWPGDDIVNKDPQNPAQEFGMKDLAVAHNDGFGTNFIQVFCTTADAVPHVINFALLHVSFCPNPAPLVAVFP